MNITDILGNHGIGNKRPDKELVKESFIVGQGETINAGDAVDFFGDKVYKTSFGKRTPTFVEVADANLPVQSANYARKPTYFKAFELSVGKILVIFNDFLLKKVRCFFVTIAENDAITYSPITTLEMANGNIAVAQFSRNEFLIGAGKNFCVIAVNNDTITTQTAATPVITDGNIKEVIFIKGTFVYSLTGVTTNSNGAIGVLTYDKSAGSFTAVQGPQFTGSDFMNLCILDEDKGLFLLFQQRFENTVGYYPYVYIYRAGGGSTLVNVKTYLISDYLNTGLSQVDSFYAEPIGKGRVIFGYNKNLLMSEIGGELSITVIGSSPGVSYPSPPTRQNMYSTCHIADDCYYFVGATGLNLIENIAMIDRGRLVVKPMETGVQARSTADMNSACVYSVRTDNKVLTLYMHRELDTESYSKLRMFVSRVPVKPRLCLTGGIAGQEVSVAYAGLFKNPSLSLDPGKASGARLDGKIDSDSWVIPLGLAIATDEIYIKEQGGG